MRKSVKVLLLAILSAVFALSALACSHEHTFSEDWSSDANKHWKQATCEHDEKIKEADHTFGAGVLNSAKTQVTKTCSVCGYAKTEAHTHTYGAWETVTPATIFADGSKKRVCTLTGCGVEETAAIDTVEVQSISVTTNPTKTTYALGETFDKTGMVVKALGADNNEYDVTSLITVEEDALTLLNNKVTVTYLTYTTEVTVEVTHTCSFASDWQLERPATILEKGLNIKPCTVPGCNLREEQEIEKVAVQSIALTTPATKLTYALGETFDATGMVVTATGVDESTADITSLCTIEDSELTLINNKVTVSYETFSFEVDVEVTHDCVFETWETDTPATLTQEGTKHSICSVEGCEEREDGVIEKVAVKSLEVTTQPTTTEYGIFQTFDKTGMVVTATGVDESTADVSDLVEISQEVFGEVGSATVTITYGGQSCEVTVTVVNNIVSVSEALLKQVGESVTINGYYVGVANLDSLSRDENGTFTDTYILIKDKNTQDIIGVRKEFAKLKTSTSQAGWNYTKQYTYGDEVVLAGVITADADATNQNYIELGLGNPANNEDTIVSQGNVVDYDLINVESLTEEGQWSEFFADVKPMTIFRITGNVLGVRYAGDSSSSARAGTRETVLTMDVDAETWPKINGKYVSLMDNVMNANVGELETWSVNLPWANNGASLNWNSVYKTPKEIDIFVMYVGSSAKQYELVALEMNWLSIHEHDKGEGEATVVNGHNAYVCTVEGCGCTYLEHVWATDWTVETPATVINDGLQYKQCTVENCLRRIEEVIPKLEVSSLEITNQPTKLEYGLLEGFDATGMVVTANGEYDVTELVEISYDPFETAGTYEVTVSYGGQSVTVSVTVGDNTISVSEALEQEVGAAVTIQGYYVGVANLDQTARLTDGTYTETYLLVKDATSDKIIPVKYNFAKFLKTSGTWECDLGLAYGDEIKLGGVVTADYSGSTMKYLVYSEGNPEKVVDTKTGNSAEITFDFTGVTQVTNWTEMKAAFTDETLPFTIIRITGDAYGARGVANSSAITEYGTTNNQERAGTQETRLHMNSGATKASNIKSSSRFINLIDNVLTTNVGDAWKTVLPSATKAGEANPNYAGKTGEAATAIDIYVMVVGVTSARFECTILDSAWLNAATLLSSQS